MIRWRERIFLFQEYKQITQEKTHKKSENFPSFAISLIERGNQ